MPAFHHISIAGCGGVAGLIVGSFLATIILRWPAGRRVAAGRSRCDGCGAALGPFELIPVLSWVLQRGRCRRCGAAIDPLHPVVEVMAACIGMIALGVAPDAAGAAGAAFGWALLLLAMLDLRHHWLPDRVTLPLIVAGLAVGWVAFPSFADHAIGAVVGYLALQSIRLLYRKARGREGLGGGDPKLFAAIGAWLGWIALAPVLLVASLLGLAAALLLKVRGRDVGMATEVPFGALLAPAAFMGWVVIAAQHSAR